MVLKISLWLFIALAIILIISLNLAGIFDEHLNFQIILGLFSGIGLGIGIVGILRTKRWERNSHSITYIVSKFWEIFVLALTISIIFHLIRENVINHRDFLQSYLIFEALRTNLAANWHIYVLFIFTLWVWILLLWRGRENKKEEFTNIEKISWPFLLFNTSCIVFLLVLYFVKIDSYNFFYINTGDNTPDPNPFLFYFLIGMFVVITFGSIPKFFNWITRRRV